MNAVTPGIAESIESKDWKQLRRDLERMHPSDIADVIIDLPATSDSDRRRAIVHGTMKLIAFGQDTYFQVFDLGTDPGELHPITKGAAYDEMLSRYRAFEETVHDVPPTKCKEGCLNGAYARKKDGG